MESSRLTSRNFKKCVVCSRRRTPGSNVFLARIPLDPDRARKWIQSIGQEDLVYIPIEKLHQLKSVCNVHFRQEDWNKSRTRLLSHAVPYLNLPLQPLNEELLHNFPLHIGQYQGHDSSEVPGTTCDDINMQSCNRQCVDKKDSSEVPGTTCDDINMQSCNRQFVDNKDSSEVPGTTCDDINMQSCNRQCVDNKGTSSELPGPSTELPGPVSKRPVPLEELPGPSASCKNVVVVKGYKRKSNETKGLNCREERLLQKLKAQKITIKNLAKTSLDFDKLDNTVLKNLVNDAAKNHAKKPAGRRWTMKTKLWALAIFKRSPKAYRYLQWAISGPSIKTLQRLLKSVPLEPGINKELLVKCKEILSRLSTENKYCALLFDEMSLKKRVIYNEHSDKVEGFEDYGDERRSNPADHVLVFMIQGLRKKFKLPVAYYFVQGTIASAKLSVIIKNVIIAIEEAGFTVVTTVCDQGPTNVGALSLLKKFGGQSPEDNYFKFNNTTKFIMFDVPHLFKSIRNNFYNAGEIVWGQKKGKWCHLVEAEEKNKNFLNFPKLNKNVVNPTYKIKMRVKYAAHALSNTMSAILHMLAWKHETAAKEITETAEIIKELDKLFDVCNGPSGPKDIKKGLRENVSSTTNHIEMWKYFGSKIEEIRFLKSDTQLQLKHVRCIKGFKISLKSLQDIWKLLQNVGFKYLNLRQLNQDALENLFGMIRQHSTTNKNPTCSHFTAALKTSILSGLTAPHSRGSNCEADSNHFLFDYKNIQHTARDEVEPTTSAAESSENVPVLSLPDEEDDILLEDLCAFEDQPVVYVSGYLASKLLRNSDCSNCKICLINENTNNDIYNYIKLREWWKDKNSLTYPSIALCKTVSQAITIFENFNNLHENNLSETCTLEFTVHCDLTWFTCTKHVELRYTLLKQLSILYIRKKCKLMNETFSITENKTNDFYKKAQVQSKA